MNEGVTDHVRELIYRDTSFLYRMKRSRYFFVADYPHCDVCPCAVCKRLVSTSRLFTVWFPCARKDDATRLLHWRVCFGCNSKFNSVYRKFQLFREIHGAILKLEKVARHAS